MQNDKSPGTDGMTVNFFKFFWKQLGSFVVRSLNEGFLKGEMSVTQKEGIIICIPKGDKPREFLKKLETNFTVKCNLQNRINMYSE